MRAIPEPYGFGSRLVANRVSGYATTMRRDSRLSRMLHVLIHMRDRDGPLTSEAIAKMLRTPAPIVRRIMGGLRNHGIVTSSKGHGGGWSLTRPLSEITMLDIYEALGEPTLFALGPASDNPTCLVEQAVDARLGQAFARAAEGLRTELRATTLDDIAGDFEARLDAARSCGIGEDAARGG